MTARPLDHLVFPTASLAAARGRLSALGFTVAPDGVHPFGTRNACMFFADGTFIEPLAIGDADVVEAAVAEGNSFVLGDRSFRAARGDDGFSAIVLGTPDADSDHEEFAALGIARGSMVEFSRPAIDMEGKADTATFRLAFASEPGTPDLFFFTCERRRAPKIDRSALERHDNGAVRLRAIKARANDPEAFTAFLAKFARSSAVRASDGARSVSLANADIHVASQDESGVLLNQIVFGVSDLSVPRAVLERNKIEHETVSNGIRVPATAGQGADFVFEEM